MVVKGMVSKTVDVDICFEEAMLVIFNELVGIKVSSFRDLNNYALLEADDKRNNTGAKGIFYVVDISYHGSPWYEYRLKVNSPEKVEAFAHIKQLCKLKEK